MTTNELDLEMPEEASSEETTTQEEIIQGGSQGASAQDDLAKELTIAKEALARAQADYRNLLSRTERDRIEMGAFLTEKLILKVLPSLDAMERIVQYTPEAEREWVVFKGVSQAASGLAKSLESLGLSSFVSNGNQVDPALHEAIMQAPGKEGEIVNEIEKGYKLGDKVIRHAKVVVGNGE